MKGTIILLMSLILVFSLPVFSAKKETILMQEQVQNIESIVKGMEEKMNAMAAEVSAMTKTVGIMDEKISALTRGQADNNDSREKLQLSLQFIKEELNELKNNLNKINDRLVSLPPSAIQSDKSSGPAPQQPDAAAAVQNADNMYYAAYSDYMRKNYPLAIEGFKQFYKANPKHDLADNSLYWIGECYYSQKLYQDAVNAFTEIITNYPEGDKVPDAYLKKGYSLLEMGKQAEGITLLKELISKFPLSEEAALAQQKIKEVTD